MEPQESFVDTLHKFLDSRLMDLHTSIPGQILSYDAVTERATVQPLVRLQRLVNNEIITVDIQPITNVPVMFLHTTHFQLKVPLVKGDGVEIRFSEVGIGNFLNGTGTVVDPDDISKFSLTDAVCTPGLWGKNIPTGKLPTIELDTSGNLTFLGGVSPFTKGDSLEILLNNFLNALASGIAPGTTPQNAASLAVIKAAAIAALPNVAGIKSLKIKGS